MIEMIGLLEVPEYVAPTELSGFSPLPSNDWFWSVKPVNERAAALDVIWPSASNSTPVLT